MLDAGGASINQIFGQDNDEERGSSHWEHQERQIEQKQPSGHFHKKTKVPLVGLSNGPNSKSAPKAL